MREVIFEPYCGVCKCGVRVMQGKKGLCLTQRSRLRPPLVLCSLLTLWTARVDWETESWCYLHMLYRCNLRCSAYSRERYLDLTAGKSAYGLLRYDLLQHVGLSSGVFL